MTDAQTLVHSDAKIRANKLAMYRQMLRIRLIEEAIATRYAEQEMRCPTHLCIGQEAPPVGVSAHLRKDDLVFSGHRSHGHYLAKGGDLKAMVAELYGRATGCAGGKGGSQHLIDLACGFMGSAPILASTISVGVGAAWAAAMDGDDRVVIVYFGDGATEEGTFHEAVNFAGVRRLPVIFVCENNLYSVHSALDIRQPPRSIASLGLAHGVAALQGDGNDVDIVQELAREAIERARSGAGATLIELATYRWKEHCGPGDDTDLGYRTQAELVDWKRRDPIATYAERLRRDAALDLAEEKAIQTELEREIEDAFQFAKTSPFPAVSELLSHVYPAGRI
jgi:TPP-dependent pyruvate/acetoin dehydrogenase alpha subunit